MYLGQWTPGFVPQQDDQAWWEEGLTILSDAAGEWVQDQTGQSVYQPGVVIPETQQIPYYDVFNQPSAGGTVALVPVVQEEEPGRAGQLLALAAVVAGGYAILRLGGAI